ncbi:uncharacterized protein LOC113283738 isoform X2 [Papaver somniferum]|uniref:uncharacterized protein LOC113283738 isoform X2 n=1 Tax=Papaver somniferum TaxID=3469 RepID=UPI000E705163|nr:uncharacterized protein LOC113283738 isoform X2 [Papaver somniferum]XP_026388864.1 uncharacterized protein LOC113283738 isoform X2 [Papaver somniferum]
MSRIPEEIIYNEILLRLPVKPLLKFKCVCKKWKTLNDVFVIYDPAMSNQGVLALKAMKLTYSFMERLSSVTMTFCNYRPNNLASATAHMASIEKGYLCPELQQTLYLMKGHCKKLSWELQRLRQTKTFFSFQNVVAVG